MTFWTFREHSEITYSLLNGNSKTFLEHSFVHWVCTVRVRVSNVGLIKHNSSYSECASTAAIIITKQLDVYDVNEISAHCKAAENESRHCPSSEQTNGEHLNISLVSCWNQNERDEKLVAINSHL